MEDNKNNQETSVMPMQPANRSVSVYLDTDRFAQMQRACRALAQSDLVPDMYRVTKDNPENKAIANCMIALDKAARFRCDPLTIMQNMGLVYGRPAWAAQFVISAINSCGRFTPLKFKFGVDGHVTEKYKVYKKDGSNAGEKTFDMDNKTCYAYATEKATNDLIEGTPVSIRMAFDEHWVQKDGSKWNTMPEQMLIYRAASAFGRAYAPDVMQGMYTREENEDIHNAEVIETTINKPERQRISLPAPDENVEQLPDTATGPVGEAEAKAAEPPADNTANQAEAKDQPPY